jgi:hypothetical protein
MPATRMNRSRAALALSLAGLTQSPQRRALYLSLAEQWTSAADDADAGRLAVARSSQGKL